MTSESLNYIQSGLNKENKLEGPNHRLHAIHSMSGSKNQMTKITWHTRLHVAHSLYQGFHMESMVGTLIVLFLTYHHKVISEGNSHDHPDKATVLEIYGSHHHSHHGHSLHDIFHGHADGLPHRDNGKDE